MPAHDAPTVRNFNPKDHPHTPLSYRHVSEVPISATTKLVTFAGQIGTDSKSPGVLLPLADQIRNTLQRVDVCLASAGVTKSDIISVRQYLVKWTSMSAEEQEARMDLYEQWWETEGDRPRPPLTLIGVDSLYVKECLFEMEVMCVGRL